MSKDKDVKIEDLELYTILNVPDDASVQDIKKAYRKTALQCHPDKNPGNKDAASKFIQLKAILELLINPESRKTYDLLRKAKLQTKLRLEKQDSKRKKLREDLERREQESALNKYDSRSEEVRLRAEIERLRKEGKRQIEEEMEAMQKKLLEDLEEEARLAASESSIYRMKLKWRKSDPTYNEKSLNEIFSKFGALSALVVSKKGGSALLEYHDLHVARLSARHAMAILENPIEATPIGWTIEDPIPMPAQGDMDEDDFEELVFKRMRAAQVYQSQKSEAN
jgi:DnaJ homolog subfamily C member 17